MIDKLRGKELMDSKKLAQMARALRAEKGLTQQELADRIISERTGESISKQMISRAESEDVGTQANALRVQIIQLLAERVLVGPVWYFEDELQEES